MKITRVVIQSTVLCIMCAGIVAEADYYSNANKSLFSLPAHASQGGSALSFSRDAAPMSNPANIPLEKGAAVSLAYTGFYENSFSTSIASFVTNLNDRIGVGMSAGYLFIPDIEVYHFEMDETTTMPIYDPSLITNENSSEIFMHFAFGYIIAKTPFVNVSVGAAIHCQRRRLIDWTGYGIGVDAGGTVELLKPGLRLSLLFDDVTTNYMHWSEDYQEHGLPHARLGIGWRREIPYIYGRVSVTYKSPDLFSNEGVGYTFLGKKSDDTTEPETQSIRKQPSLLFSAGAYGVEYLIQNVVALRAGLDEPKRLFFGAGVGLFNRALIFDFAYMVSYELPGAYSLCVSYGR